MIPGPTPVPEKVLQALGKHPIGHRSKDFQDLVASTTQNLKWLHQTDNDVLTITGSGTAAMEAGIINTLNKGDKVICGENGKFGERWVKVAKAYGLNVITVKAKWGDPLDPDSFKKILNEEKDIRAVIITHSETSTGVINDLEKISKYVHAHGKALCCHHSSSSFVSPSTASDISMSSSDAMVRPKALSACSAVTTPPEGTSPGSCVCSTRVCLRRWGQR